MRPVPKARELLDSLRAVGIITAVISNQSGVGRGLITVEQVESVNARVDELLGPFAGFFYCPHTSEANCECRKPSPKLILDAAERAGVRGPDCILVGDKASDVEAARNAGARSILIDERTTLADAVQQVLAD